MLIAIFIPAFQRASCRHASNLWPKTVAHSEVTLSQSTLSGNSTTGNYSHGGGIHAFSVTLSRSTVTDNHALHATSIGGGVFQMNKIANDPILISSSIVSANTASTGPDLVKDPGSTLTVNYSLIGTTACGWPILVSRCHQPPLAGPALSRH